MKKLKSMLLAGGALVILASVAQAADLPTRKAPVVSEKPNCFASFRTWIHSTPTDCPLSYWGVTLYGQVDVGGGWESNKARFNKANPNGVAELVSKQSHGAGWQIVPNGLNQSNVGIKWKEQIVPDWFFVGDVKFGFDPYSLQFANGERSLVQNTTTPQYFQNYNRDSSFAYGPIDTRAYAGFQNKMFGTLTYGRQFAFSNDIANSLYDPYGGAYAFSLIGNSSTFGGGLGNTELARYNNSLKYIYADHDFRLGAMTQVGGWSAGNNAQFAFEVTGGFDWNGFSVDAVYEHAKDAVALSTFNTGTFGTPFGVNQVSPTLLKATISNEDSFQVGAKYKWDHVTLYGGYEYQRLTNPSIGANDLPLLPTIRSFIGGAQALYGATGDNTQGNAFNAPKQINLFWAGAKYALLSNVDLIGAYYYVHQNDFSAGTATCAANVVPVAAIGAQAGAAAAAAGYTPQGSNSSKCSGNEYAVSGAVDWKPVKRVDLYGGAMFSKVNGGLANGFFVNSNLAVTGGVRVSF